MARAAESDVTARIDTSLSTAQIEAFIDDANSWVDEYLTDCGASDARLKKVEIYLACHYVTLRDPRLRSQAVEDARETYQRDTEVTEYLKQAAAEDPCGIVKARLLAPEETPTVSGRARVYDRD